MRSENVSRSCLTDPRIKYAKALKILTYAQELIRDPAHWTQFMAARDESGQFCHPASADAMCWCAFGALRRHAHAESMDFLHARNAVDRAAVEARTDGYVTLNDTRSHADVMAMFDRAKELLGEWP